MLSGGLLNLTALLVSAAAAPPAVPSVELRSDEILNLVYQLDCLPGGAECPFLDLWKNELGWTAADDAALARRQAIRERYGGYVTVDESLDDAPLMFDAPRLITATKKMLLASAGAADIAAYRARLELVLTPTDAAEMATLTERFLPRFRRFFSPARRRLETMTGQLRSYFAQPSVRQVVQRAMAFYEVPAGLRHRLEVQLVALPGGWKGHTRGEQVENLSTVEVQLDASVAGKGSIVLHELFHYFYACASGQRARALAAAFAAADDPGAAAAYGLLNEGVATALSAVTRKAAFGPDKWQHELSLGGHWYNDGPIDTVAKAIYQWLDERLERGLGLYEPSFVPGYVGLVRAAMGPQLDRPVLKLRTLVVAVEDEHIRSLRGVSAGRSLVGRPLETPEVSQALLTHPAQSGVVMLRGKSLARLRSWEPVLGAGIVERATKLYRASGPLILGVKRGRSAVIYLLVGDTDADFETLQARLLAAEAPFEVLSLRRSK